MIEFIIGREAGVDKPRLAVMQNDQTLYFGTPGSVPKSVSRKHCEIIVKDDSSVVIEDITENNFMFVNGVECKKKKNVSISDVIELGPTHYKLELESLLKTVSSKQSYSIRHLEAIQEKYQQDKMDMQVKQTKFGAMSSIPGIVSSVSFLLMMAWNDKTPRMILGTIAVLGMAAFFCIRYFGAAKNPTKQKQLEDNYREQYVCPNPACHRFLGVTPYKELLKNRTCPYCKTRFIE